MKRRTFVLAGGTAAALAGSGAGFWRWQEITGQVRYPGREQGHAMRDLLVKGNLPSPSGEIRTDVLIAGSGIAALSAAWTLQRAGHEQYLMVQGPELYGNAAGRIDGELAYPTGAHYLPLPSMESTHIRQMLSDLGVLMRNPGSERPYYDERYVVHAPDERLLFQGHWQDGLIPTEGATPEQRAEHERFLTNIDRLRDLHGSDGRRIFTIPVEQASNDPVWRALDQLTFKAWLLKNQYQSATLHWYLDYCCRDDYGTHYDQISAWAGLHYFCSRAGQAENASRGAVLTWPAGLHPLAAGLDKLAGTEAGKRRMAGSIISLKEVAGGVEALCLLPADASARQGTARTIKINARRAICAMPLFAAAHVVEGIRHYGFDPAIHLPRYAPWLVSNFILHHFPEELPGVPLAWDNVIYGETGLGYVVSTHQQIRMSRPERTVFSAYHALADGNAKDTRRWLDQASTEELTHIASAGLKQAYGWNLAPCIERLEITARGHAMAAPQPGFLSNSGLLALRQVDGPILFAHSDLSGFSVCEEAAWWGCRAGRLALA